MSLPPLDPDGYLPDGIHASTLDEVYERLVLGSPDRQRRELLFMGVRTQLTVLKDLIGDGHAWLTGALVDPGSADVARMVVFPGDTNRMNNATGEERIALTKALTVGSVILGRPGPLYLEQLHPIAGLVDAHLGTVNQESRWRAACTSVADKNANRSSKGIVEVAL